MRLMRLVLALASVLPSSGLPGQEVPPAPRAIVGIFGGMGPEATAEFYRLLVRLTPAARDQEHIPALLYSLPQVPDRTAAIRSGDEAIVPYLVEGVTRLERAGASFIAIPCNTAHFFHDRMQRAVRIPILDMIKEAAAAVAAGHPGARRVGLLATTGTIGTGLYGRALAALSLEAVTADAGVQEECVMAAVYGIKAGGPKGPWTERLAAAGKHLEGKGAEVILLGCTEIPLAFDPARSGVPVVDATRVLAERAIARWREAAAAPPPAGPRRLRELGVRVGILPAGPLGAITDVAGVRVGHATLAAGDNIRTGVTAILPHGGNLFQEKVPAGIHVGNGFGKLAGSTQVDELGTLEAPILLTNTLAVAAAVEAAVAWTLSRPGNEEVRSVNAVVGETNDGWLNDIRGGHVKPAHALEAIARAAPGEVAVGAVGAGTGTMCFGFKGGIGTASRRLPEELGGWTVGVLVQTNFGGVLQVAGAPVGRELGRHYLRDRLPAAGDGSCMIVAATDAPLSARNLRRLAARAMLGLARTGGVSAGGSGDYVIAFSTAEKARVPFRPAGRTVPAEDVAEGALTPLFLAVAEAAEEAILDSLFAAVTVRGRDGNTGEALPLDRVLPILARHGLLSGPAPAGGPK